MKAIAPRAALAAAALALVWGGTAQAAGAVPRLLTFSGYLVDAAGKPAGATTLGFALYQGRSDTVPLWSEGVAVTPSPLDGYFSAVLGATTAIPSSLAAYWLGITYPGEPEMSRVAITATPWALVAESAEGAQSLVCAGCVGSAQIAAGAVTASALASGAVGAANLSPPPSCAASQVLTWSGTAWTCASAPPASAATLAPPSPCGASQVLTWSGTAWTCASAPPASAATLAPPSPCGASQVLTWSGTAWTCATPPPPPPPSLLCAPQSAAAGPAGILGGTVVATVTCPAGYSATGGGYTSTTRGANVTVESSPASPSQWSFFIKNNDTLASWSGTVYAQCCRAQ